MTVRRRPAGSLALIAACACLAAFASPCRSAAAAGPGPNQTAGGVQARNDYASRAFVGPLSEGLRHFYARDFKAAQADFERALGVVPDNTLAISFLNAAAAQSAGDLDVLANVEEDAMSGAPKSYLNHVRLGFTYMFESVEGRDRTQDAREELNAAVALDPDAPAAHVGLGILRFEERSANRAKTELLTALRTDPNNVLAREYLGQLYQTDLRDPQRGLQYVIDVPNLVPQYADIAFHIGSLLADLHQDDAAIKYLSRGIALDTDHVGEAGQHGYTLIARIYIDQHRLKDATAILTTAINDDVDTIYARTLLEKIKNGDYDPSPAPKP
jgi:tetratricopeptide (TPR) repeat protein